MSDSVTSVKTGEWVAEYYHPWIGVVIACSVCRHRVKHASQNPKFCPECGVSMANWNETPRNWGRALDSF